MTRESKHSFLAGFRVIGTAYRARTVLKPPIQRKLFLGRWGHSGSLTARIFPPENDAVYFLKDKKALTLPTSSEEIDPASLGPGLSEAHLT
jgi:hypothetical protein